MDKAKKYIWIGKIIILYICWFIVKKIILEIFMNFDYSIILEGILKTAKVILSVLIYKLLRNKQEILRQENGRSSKKNIKNFWRGICWGSNTILLIIILMIATGVIRIIDIHMISIKQILIQFGIYMFVAVTEEIYSRGVVLGFLLESRNKYIIYLGSGILFACLHLNNNGIGMISFSNIVFAGVIMAIMYVQTNTLWMSIGFHFSWNMIQALMNFNVSGNENTGSLCTLLYQKENEWLTGGIFGLEGSIFASIVLMFMIWWSYVKLIQYKR